MTLAVEARQEAQVLLALGVMGVAHWQQRMVGRVPVSDVGGGASSMMVRVVCLIVW